MKFSAQVFALLISQTASAFTVNAPKSFGTELNQAIRDDYSNYRTQKQEMSPGRISANRNMNYKDTSNSVNDLFSEMRTQPSIDLQARRSTQQVFREVNCVPVQGGTLKTCSFDEAVDRATVMLKTEGRPLNAEVELWQGPNNTPQKMSVYLEDGCLRPFRAIIESPGSSNAVSIRNTGQMEFPLTAGVEVDMSGPHGDAAVIAATSDLRIVQGGAVYTTAFPPQVQSVQIMLTTDGRPLDVRVELLQGPNNSKQVMEVYTEDGGQRPFFCILDTPGSGNVVRIVNTATVEFPLSASVTPYVIDHSLVQEVSGGGMTWR